MILQLGISCDTVTVREAKEEGGVGQPSGKNVAHLPSDFSVSRFIESVASIESQCFSDPWSLDMIGESLNTGLDKYFLLVERGEAAGYCVFRVIAGEGELFRIGVLPAYRGLGYGKKLMDGLVEYSRENGVSAISLEVRESNRPARNLYKSYGFEEESIRRDYYRNPVESAIILWKRGI